MLGRKNLTMTQQIWEQKDINDYLNNIQLHLQSLRDKINNLNMVTALVTYQNLSIKLVAKQVLSKQHTTMSITLQKAASVMKANTSGVNDK
jgi:Mg2+ and Co2+ transporter CorA